MYKILEELYNHNVRFGWKLEDRRPKLFFSLHLTPHPSRLTPLPSDFSTSLFEGFDFFFNCTIFEN